MMFTSTLAAAAGATAIATVSTARASTGEDRTYKYPIQRTDAEWKARLTKDEYKIMREMGTEWPGSHPFSKENSAQVYACKGCNLPLYDAKWYSPQPIGFVFFEHSKDSAVMTAIDTTDYNGALKEPQDFVEVHCRDCQSHLGHIVSIEGKVLHCINGLSLVDAATVS